MWPEPTRKWIKNEVGEECLRFLAYTFHPHLFRTLPKNDEITYRLAPSIITRSECEVLSLSAPRFAIRASFKNGSFINVRRILSVARWARSWEQPTAQSARFSLDHESAALRGPKEIHESSSQRCLAEGLIIPGEHLAELYHFVTSDLFAAFGEQLETTGRNVAGVPFVQSIELGGGLCAQAVCFMAACAVSDYAKGIHGLGEISAIASKCENSEEDIVIPFTLEK